MHLGNIEGRLEDF